MTKNGIAPRTEVDVRESLAAPQFEIIRLKATLYSAQTSISQSKIEWDAERGKLIAELHDGRTAKEKLVEAASVMKALLLDNQKCKCDAESWRTENIKLRKDVDELKAELCMAEEKVDTACSSFGSQQVSSGEKSIEDNSSSAHLPPQDGIKLSWMSKLDMLVSQSIEARKRLLHLEPELEAAKLKIDELEKSQATHSEGGAPSQTVECLQLKLEDLQSSARSKSPEVENLEARVRELEHEAERCCKEFEAAQKEIVDARKTLAEAETAGMERLQNLQLELEQAQSYGNKKAAENEKLVRQVSQQEQHMELAVQREMDKLKKELELDQAQLHLELQRSKEAGTAARKELDMLREKLVAANKHVKELIGTVSSGEADIRGKEMKWEQERLELRSQLLQQCASSSDKESTWADEKNGLELQIQQLQLDAVGINDKNVALNTELKTLRTSLVEAESAHERELLSVDTEKKALVAEVNVLKEASSALEHEVHKLKALYARMQEQHSRIEDGWKNDKEQLLAANKTLASAKESASRKLSEAQQLEGKVLQLENDIKTLSRSLRGAQEEIEVATEVWESEKSQLCLQLEHFKATTTASRNEAIVLTDKLLAGQGELRQLSDTLVTVQAQSIARAKEWKEESVALNSRLQQGELNASRIKDGMAASQSEIAILISELTQAREQYQLAMLSWAKEKEDLISTCHERCSSFELDVQRLNDLLAGAERALENTEKVKGCENEQGQLSGGLQQSSATVSSLSAELELLRHSLEKAEDAHMQVVLTKEREKQILLDRLDAAHEVTSRLQLEVKRVTTLLTETEQQRLEAQVIWVREKQELALQLAQANAVASRKVSDCNQLKAELTRYESYLSNLHAMLVAAKKSSRVKDTNWNEEREKTGLQIQQAELDKMRTMDEVTLLLTRVEVLESQLESLKGSIESVHSPECMADVMEKCLQWERERLKELAAGIAGQGSEMHMGVEHLQRTRQEMLRIEDRIRKLEVKRNLLIAPSQKAARASMRLSAPPSTTSSCCPRLVEQEAVIVLHPDFHVFDNDRTEKDIASNQIWAIYEEHDGMPRRYGQILEVTSSPFSVVMRWLVPVLSKQSKAWVAFTGMALSCGDFQLGKRRVVHNVKIFSHMMAVNGGTESVNILPKQHDVWALYQTSDNKWPDVNKDGGKQTWFDIVEVMGDFSDLEGVAVVPLSKVPGFRTLFQRSSSPSNAYCTKDLFRFSHKIPAFRLAGNEASGLPKQCLELDPASVPLDMICG